MLIKNIRTGVVQDVQDRLAKALIAKGACVEVKPEPEKKPAEIKKDTVKPQKNKYKTKDLKAEA
ncbi:MAG TPA: hypothetical protein VL020_02065 [Pseudomonadales bacterium]|nr:hypothetical protein [Pseudomonadales bacterium]